MKEVYQKLKQDLLGSGEIQTVQMYSNQIARLVSAKNDTGVMGFPAVLVEFTNIRYFQLGNNEQQYTATVRLYTVVQALEEVGELILDTMETVHGVASKVYTENTTRLIRVADDTDNDYKNVCVNITDYEFRGSTPSEPNQTAVVRTLGITVDVKPTL